MNCGFDKDVHASNSVQSNFLVLVLSPVAHPGHVRSAGVVLLVAFSQDNIFVETSGESSALVRLDPRIIVKATFDVSSILISMKPNICK